MLLAMIDFLRLLAYALTRLFRSRVRLEAEILVLRHQLNVLRRQAPSGTFGTCWDRTKDITMTLARTYR